MLFNSTDFVIFLPCVWVLYVLARHRTQNVLLLVASYIFYACWDWRFLSLLWISTVVDFFSALGMKRFSRFRRPFLFVSLLTNLGLLGTFKYFDFFAHSTARVMAALGLNPDVPTLNLILPVGISFYTFQTMAYSIDVYRGRIRPTNNLLTFAIYVAYFPQLVAGPIERADKLLPQIQSSRKIHTQDLFEGVALCLMGYLKKVFIADNVAPLVSWCFSSPTGVSWLGLAVGVYLFALQIYGDFSGYSDIARGVSRFFGIKLCLNFRQPYLAPNITEFWRRWHISLSAWLRDYVYIPLGGNRLGRGRTFLNIISTMLLGGLWHGAGWTFLIWGGLHGLYLVVHKTVLGVRKSTWGPPPGKWLEKPIFLLKCFVTFNLVCIAWVFFRSPDLSSSLSYIYGVFSFQSGEVWMQGYAYFIFFGACAFLIDALCFCRKSEVPVWAKWPPALQGLAYGTMLFLILCVGESNVEPFIYFQF